MKGLVGFMMLKIPLQNLIVQHHLLGEFENWTPDKLEFFFSEELGVLGIDGRPKVDAQVP